MAHPPPGKTQAKVVPDDPEQFQRFVEKARELGIEEVGEPYERAVGAVLSRRRASEPTRQRTRPVKKSPG
jgi:hypothetical protein